MKRIAPFLLIPLLLTAGFSACKPKVIVAPTCADVIAAYETAGYLVFHQEDVSEPMKCYVKVWLDGNEYTDYAEFRFFATAEEAEAYDEERNFNILIYLFTVIFGDPSWLYTETCGNIAYEYDNRDTIKPFQDLIG